MENIHIDFNGNEHLLFKRNSENQSGEAEELLLSESEFNKLKVWLEYTGRDAEKIIIKTVDTKEFIIYKNHINYVRLYN